MNGVSSGYAPISPTRNSPMRTITQSSIKTNGTDGVIQVMPISENRIREGREVVAGSERPQRELFAAMGLHLLIVKLVMRPVRMKCFFQRRQLLLGANYRAGSSNEFVL